MKFLDIVRMARQNTFRSKVRAWLTVIAVGIGAFTLTVTNGIGAGISQYITTQIGNVGNATTISIEAKSDSPSGPPFGGEPIAYDPNKRLSAPSGGFAPQEALLTNSDLTKIQAVPGITDTYAGRMIIADFVEGKNNQRYRANVSAASGRTIELEAGSAPSDRAQQPEFTVPSNFVSVLGYDTAQSILGSRLTIGLNDANGKAHTVSGTVTGVQMPTLLGSHTLLGNHAFLGALYDVQSQGLSSTARESYSFIIAQLADTSEPATAAVKQRLDTAGYSAATMNDELGIYKQVIDIAIIILSAFACIVLIAAGFGIVNTLFMAVQERTKEIGLMKALGMSRQQVFLLFSIEALLLGLIGSMLGVGLGVVIGLLANIGASNTILADFDGFSLLAFPVEMLLIIMAIIIATAFLAGTLPARRAAAEDPITALRYE